MINELHFFLQIRAYQPVMENPLSKKLFPISELQEIRGVKLPVGLEFLQLVVTGPPGAGKTYYINQIGGWPNEGYIDLTRKGWWKDQSLTYRPREINLGLPFKGHKEALTVFDKEWIEASPPLQLEPNRIKILPEKDFLFSTNWRNRYIFEFLIPPPEIIYERRKKRHKEGYFPVDANLSLSMVRRQVADYRQIALYLHRAGISVYIREKLEGPPMRIAETGEVQLPHWTIPRQNRRPSLRSWAGWKWLLLKKDPNHWLTLSTDLTDIKKESRISHDGKGFVLIMGKQLLRFNPEIPLGASKRYLRHNRNWLITAADAYSSDKISGFARLKAGETVMIGASNIEYNNIFSFHESVRERHLNITNLRGDLIITPLSRDNPIQVVRDEEIDYREQLENRRYNSLMTIRRLLGYPGRMMAEKQALSLLEKTVKVLENEVYRQLDNSGMPGGLLELPDQPVPVIIGDLHGQINNLLKILSEENLIEMIEN
ncbi:MAG: serine/threonine protein phosphatase, partial [Deltaproteobacteria bacterium]